ncbi:MAG TPA: PAS domain-containing protein, partial [Myxococcaceae bacterium]|nr:PAS domain-containing protein [Myxococcaceae bacterium]
MTPPAATPWSPPDGSPVLPAVLLVGGSVDLRAELAVALQPLGVRLVEAASEDAALRHVRGEDFAAILVDVTRGGGLDGLGTARAIRSFERGRLTPLLLLSDADLEDAQVPRGEDAGWVDVLRKPVRAEALRGRVGILLELFRARAEVRRQAEVIRQQAQAQAEASHRERLEGLLMRAPAAIAVTRGEAFVFEFVNPLYERVVGRTIRLGAPLSEALPEMMEQPEVLEALRGVMRTGQPFVARAFRVALRREPGSPLEEAFFDLVLQPTFDARGRVEGMVSFAVDVTEATLGRKRAETLSERLAQREAQLRIVTDALPALVSFIGRDERYQLVNQAYTEWFGLEREQVVGRHVREVVGEAAYAAVRPFIERALAGESFTF